MSSTSDSCRFRWLALAATTAAHGLSVGTVYSVGVLYPEWIRDLTSHASYVSFVGSLASAVGCISGPIATVAVLEKVGSRWCGFLGGCLMFFGLASCYFANSVLYLLFCFGVISGVGAGLVIVSFSAVVNSYFVKDRAMAEGVVGGGLGAGIFAISAITQKLIEAYTWRGAMLLQAGVCFNLCVVSMFFIPKTEVKDHPLNLWKTPTSPDLSLGMMEVGAEVKDNVKTSATVSAPRQSFIIRSRRLWGRPLFLLLITVDFLSLNATFIPLVHLTERARQHGIEASTAAWLSSTMGLCGILARPLLGTLCSYLGADPFRAYSLNQGLLGVATFLSPYWSDVYGLFTMAVVYGVLSNGYGFIKTSAADMLGREHFVDGFSWLLFLEGVGICLGPLIAGSIVDATHSYDWSFRFCGLLLLASASICLLRSPLQRLEARLRN